MASIPAAHTPVGLGIPAPTTVGVAAGVAAPTMTPSPTLAPAGMPTGIAAPSVAVPVPVVTPEERARFKSTNFKTQGEQCFKFCRTVLDLEYKDRIEMEGKPSEYLAFEKFTSYFFAILADPSKPPSHESFYQYFERFYADNRVSIVSDTSAWWGQKLQFGAGRGEAFLARCADIYLSLPFIHQAAIAVSNRARDVLASCPDPSAPILQPVRDQVIFPGLIKLYFVRMFYLLLPETSIDLTKISETITKLEERMKMAERFAGSEPWKAVNPLTSGDPMARLFGMAQKVMEPLGLKAPPGMKPPSSEQMIGMAETLLNNPATAKILGQFTGIAKQAAAGGSVSEVIQSAVQMAGNKETINMMESASVSIRDSMADSLGQPQESMGLPPAAAVAEATYAVDPPGGYDE